ncbi:MAG: HPr family phosphocarrier protein [Syntrophorhabdaceae bacterium]|nr:HPr family phosphocarrier protein [Syntrophorhabdaceae bacterium]
MEMSMEREFNIKNLLGLHARAAAQLVNLANRYASDIKLEKEEMQVNGKSIMGVLMLAAPKGAKIRVLANGADANEALVAIGELIDSKFGEE